jgi:error-prone DNA polymerase
VKGYAELQATSNFSFLRAGSHPDELVTAAAALGLSAIGIADRNSLAGVVRLSPFGRRPRGARRWPGSPDLSA